MTKRKETPPVKSPAERFKNSDLQDDQTTSVQPDDNGKPPAPEASLPILPDVEEVEITIRLPLARENHTKMSGFQTGRIDTDLRDEKLKLLLKRLWVGLDLSDARTEAGRHVESLPAAVLWLFERLEKARYSEQVEAARRGRNTND